ncbi:hypothetical protein KSD_25680 [Ktedonobacter sp. SOSP1-85]|uniref:alpha/beta fold hydrolase n=1 Tax=Ktedonobacter sp. SOSP1-85 TaxID=2778367 RepID=UPI001915F68E|nr:alpha/beta hydrolase [Ktedonobacter sp. SOSP1-85]GHO74797.1 hypothetical protein KSD_25680 [Ktedonobacter sp. SOSP1-85]
MIKPRSSFVDTDIIRLHYLEWDPAQLNTAQEQSQEWDNDNIPLILLHGLGATADTWHLVAGRLYKHSPVIAFDLRGHGLSEQPETGYDLVNIAEDVVHGMAALGLGQVALVGHGWGDVWPWPWPRAIPRLSAILCSSIARMSSHAIGLE